MAILKITQIGHPVLREATRPLLRAELAQPETQRLIDDMIETKRDADGAGIAANQVDASFAICVIEVAESRRYPYKPSIPLTVLINPVLEVIGDETFASNEGCLSVPLRGGLRRHLRVRVTAWDRDGNDVLHEPVGLTAGTYQHEIDHLQGRLFVDRVADPRTLSTWPMFDRFQRDEFVSEISEFVERTGG
jgi:peptide deformylase